MAKLDKQATVDRFVVRARRIKAHTLASNLEELAQLASRQWTLQLDFVGRQCWSRELPDEERFESFAARLRPLTLPGESIYLPRVLTAIEGAAELDGEEFDTLAEQLCRLKKEWDRVSLDTEVESAYYAQQFDKGGVPVDEAVSEKLLAGGWFYSDVAHADPRPDRAAALRYSITMRYAAAVGAWSNLAILAIATLHLVENLNSRGALHVRESALTQDVVLNRDELNVKGTAYLAPVGTAVPTEMSEAPVEWTRATITTVLRNEEWRQATVRTLDAGEHLIAEFVAVTLSHEQTETAARWEVLVDESVRFEFDWKVVDGKIEDVDIARSLVQGSNSLYLRALLFLEAFNNSCGVEFFARNECVLRITGGLDGLSMTDTDPRLFNVLVDLAAIETILERPLPVPLSVPSDHDRIQIRKIRLMLQGHAVLGPNEPVEVTVESGRTPDRIARPAFELAIDSDSFEVPQTQFWHSEMSVEDLGLAGNMPPPARRFRASPPHGECFFAWMPERLKLNEVGQVSVVSDLQLPGIEDGAPTSGRAPEDGREDT